jgi:hypothetical protein
MDILLMLLFVVGVCARVRRFVAGSRPPSGNGAKHTASPNLQGLRNSIRQGSRTLWEKDGKDLHIPSEAKRLTLPTDKE